MPRKRTTKPKRKPNTNAPKKRQRTEVLRDKNGRFVKWRVLTTCSTLTGRCEGAPLSPDDKLRLEQTEQLLGELEDLIPTVDSEDAGALLVDYIRQSREQIAPALERAQQRDSVLAAVDRSDGQKVYVSNVDWTALDPGNMDPADVAQINRLLGKGFIKRVKAKGIRGNRKRWFYEIDTRRTGTKKERIPLDHPALVRVGWDDDIRRMIEEGNSGIEVFREA